MALFNRAGNAETEDMAAADTRMDKLRIVVMVWLRWRMTLDGDCALYLMASWL